jgi:hypothetical protein
MRRLPSQYLPGRPSYYADIDLSRDLEQGQVDAFYSVMSSLTYREMMALSRTLGCNYVTVWRWKQIRTVPRDGIVKLIIRWGSQGKPLIKKQRERFSML